jgi:hypothetical protein
VFDGGYFAYLDSASLLSRASVLPSGTIISQQKHYRLALSNEAPQSLQEITGLHFSDYGECSYVYEITDRWGNQWYDRPSIRIHRHLGRNLALSCFGHRQLWCKLVQYFSMKRTQLSDATWGWDVLCQLAATCVSVCRRRLRSY